MSKEFKEFLNEAIALQEAKAPKGMTFVKKTDKDGDSSTYVYIDGEEVGSYYYEFDPADMFWTSVNSKFKSVKIKDFKEKADVEKAYKAKEKEFRKLM